MGTDYRAKSANHVSTIYLRDVRLKGNGNIFFYFLI